MVLISHPHCTTNNKEPISGMVENDDDDAEWTDGVGEQDARRDSIANVMWEQY